MAVNDWLKSFSQTILQKVAAESGALAQGSAVFGANAVAVAAAVVREMVGVESVYSTQHVQKMNTVKSAVLPYYSHADLVASYEATKDSDVDEATPLK